MRVRTVCFHILAYFSNLESLYLTVNSIWCLISSHSEGRGFPAKKDLFIDCRRVIMASAKFPVLEAMIDAWRKWVAHV